MPDYILEISSLRFAYKDGIKEELLFSDLSFQLGWNECLAIIGTSGCGKSTLLKLIFGNLEAQSGKILCRGKHIVYLSQEETLIPWESVINNLLLPFKLKKQYAHFNKLKEDALQLLVITGLEGYENSYACELSGGMRKRLELARSLLQKPDLLLLDEPFSALDFITKEHIMNLCKNLQKQYKFSTILVSHNLEDVFSLCDRSLVLGKSFPNILYQFDIKSHKKNSENLPYTHMALEDPTYSQHIREIRRSLSKDFIQQKEKHIIPARYTSTKMRLSRKKPMSIFTYSMTILVLIGLVFLGKYLANLPDYLIPHPFDILNVFFQTLRNGSIFPDLFMTIFLSGIGFSFAFLIATPLGYFISHFIVIKRLCLPVAIISNSLPIIALAPFFLLWLGVGFLTRILITILVIFFPLLLTSKQAFDTAYNQTSRHRQVLSGHPMRYFLYLDWPYALPILFTGWKAALSGSIMGTIIADFVVNNKGLGSLISIAKSRFDTPLMFVSLIWLALLGLTYFSIIYIIESIVLTKIRSCG